MRTKLGIVSMAVIISSATVASAENWSQFRGAGASGLTGEARLPTTWGPEQNVAWKVKLPGMAWSQPVVWGERIFVTTAVTENQSKPSVGQGGGRGGFGGPRPGGSRPPQGDEPRRQRGEADRPDAPRAASDGPAREDGNRPGREGGGRGGIGRAAGPPDQTYRWLVLCLDGKTGQVLWEQLAHEGKPTIATHRSNTYASETPVVDGERVYAYFGMIGLFAYDLAGKLLWHKDVGHYDMSNGWGTGSSPVIDGDRLFLQCDNEVQSFLLALDKRTGDELWRVTRAEQSNWSTPYVWRNGKRTELVTAGGGKMRSYDPATGKVLWELAGVTGRCSATPVGTADLLYLGVGGGRRGAGPLVAIRAGAEGELSSEGDKPSEGIAWVAPRGGPPLASPLVYQGNVYVLEQRGGIVGCYDAATGQEHYRKRIEGAKGFTSSPWASDGKIYCLDEDGQTFVLEAGPELKVVGTNKLNDQFWSSVAVAKDHLLLRGVEYLYSIGP
ncbi:MAG: PQQ-binding-like beta-propeller repeat protein [Pirellulales bacterium]